jgi:hypothetical protein
LKKPASYLLMAALYCFAAFVVMNRRSNAPQIHLQALLCAGAAGTGVAFNWVSNQLDNRYASIALFALAVIGFQLLAAHLARSRTSSNARA